ncbi:hypothetical protein BGZ46_000327 [Entomortierella lignicola]|nr:hypothetical protein BGZ46_000327 [Entomortierella lignicola]
MSVHSSSETRLSNLKDVIGRGLVKCGIPGLGLAILHKGKLIFADGFGIRNDKDPFTAETLAPIGSLTKSFTATAIGELVAEGKMDWDKTPVNKFLPEFELKDPVLTSQLTLVDLLSHRTGLKRNTEFSWAFSTKPRRELIKSLKNAEMPSKLSPWCNYNNVMYTVAGEAAANIAGLTYEDVVRKKVLEPLQLLNTGFSTAEMKKRSSNYAFPYSAASAQDAQDGLFRLEEHDNACVAIAPAGDMYSNVLDMVRWGKTIMNAGELDGKQVLNKESVLETLNPYTIMQEPRRTPEFAPVSAYCLGWMVDSYKGHTFYTHNADLVIAQLVNIQYSHYFATSVSSFVADEILELPKTQDWIFDVAIEETKKLYEDMDKLINNLPERIQNKPASRELQAYVGEYSHLIHGEATVRLGKDEKTGEDILLFKTGAFEGKLDHYHFESFSFNMQRYCIELAEPVTFQTGRDGRVKSLEFVENEFRRK